MATSTFAGSSFTFGKPFAWLCLHLLLRFSTSLPLSTSCFITFLCSSSHPLAAVFWFTCLVTLAPLRPVASLSWSGTILLAFASVFAFIPATFNSMAVLLPHVTPLGLDSVDYAFVTLRPSTPFLATHQRGVTAFIAHLVDRVSWFDGPGTTRTGHAAIEAPNRSKIGTVFNFYALPPFATFAPRLAIFFVIIFLGNTVSLSVPLALTLLHFSTFSLGPFSPAA